MVERSYRWLLKDLLNQRKKKWGKKRQIKALILNRLWPSGFHWRWYNNFLLYDSPWWVYSLSLIFLPSSSYFSQFSLSYIFSVGVIRWLFSCWPTGGWHLLPRAEMSITTRKNWWWWLPLAPISALWLRSRSTTFHSSSFAVSF